MNTHVRTLSLLRRVGVRAGVGVWRNRGGVLLASLVSVALVGYVIMSPGRSPNALAQAAPIGTTADCANTVMTAIAGTSSTAAQQANQCMSPGFQQRGSEPSFDQQIQALRVPNASSVTRLGAYQTPTGGTLVYYAVDSSVRTIGYVVYLGPAGRVVQIK